MTLFRVVTVMACVCLGQAAAGAQSVTLTLDEAFARAREQAPAMLIARARIEEARGRLAGARVRHRDNPTIDASTGPRSTDVGTLTDVDIGISQVFETGGQRAARVAGAEAGMRRAEAATADARRLALRDVGIAFLRLLHAQERVALLQGAETLAADVFRVANRRYAAGDIAILDVNVANTAQARARAARLAADAERVEAAGLLQRLLGLGLGPGPSRVRDAGAGGLPVARGTLRLSRLSSDGPVASGTGSRELAALVAAVDERPDLQALRADIADAQADAQLGQAMTKPDVGVGARYKHEEGHRAILGEVTITLPVFARGQELRTTGSARAARLRLELETARDAAIGEVESAYVSYAAREAAVAAFEQGALAGLDENERLAQRSFDVGQISLPELLLIRRELVETRLEYLDRLLDASEAAMTRDALAGVLR